jgi:signal-transduction protein with cAMP-binding, CBS, and nucleotidyltransferase domain|tara:strand:- start:113 stop:583 length:471 start_codon:yes stop_codon:yes gene_type:complete
MRCSITNDEKSLPKVIRDLLNNKSDILLTVLPDTDIREATGLMIDQSISALMALSKDGSLAGILTERDVARYLVSQPGKTTAPVPETMTSDLITCTHEHEVSEIAKIMSDSNIRHLPVIVDGGVIGVVSIRDIVKFHLADLGTENRTLHDLVSALG